MSADNPSAADLDQLSQSVNALKKEATEIRTAMSRGRQVRLGIFLVLLAVVVYFVFQYVAFFEQFTKEEKLDEFMQAAQTEFFGDEDPETAIQDSLDQMAQSSGETVQEIFRAQVEADMGKYTAALDEQREILAINLEERLNALVDEHYEELLDQHGSILKEKFKDRSQFSEEQLGRMIHNMEEGVKVLLKKYYVEELQKQLDALYNQYENFPVADAAKPGDQPLEKQLLQKMAEMVSLKLSRTSDPAVIPPPAPKPEEDAEPADDADQD